jgi:hypothetical protein
MNVESPSACLPELVSQSPLQVPSAPEVLHMHNGAEVGGIREHISTRHSIPPQAQRATTPAAACTVRWRLSSDWRPSRRAWRIWAVQRCCMYCTEAHLAGGLAAVKGWQTNNWLRRLHVCPALVWRGMAPSPADPPPSHYPVRGQALVGVLVLRAIFGSWYSGQKALPLYKCLPRWSLPKQV